MRLDFEAAEKSYRTFRSELGRVLRAGGAKKATPVMKATATGEYLKTFEDLTAGYKRLRGKDVGKENIGFLHRGGYSPTALLLDSCEDTRQVITYRAGESQGPGQVTIVKLEVVKQDGRWKVSNGDGRKVESCQEG